MFINIFRKLIGLSQQSYQLTSKACVGNPVNVLKCRYSTISFLILPVDLTFTTADVWYSSHCYTLQIGLQAFNLLALLINDVQCDAQNITHYLWVLASYGHSCTACS
jgi:hypothetical protein